MSSKSIFDSLAEQFGGTTVPDSTELDRLASSMGGNTATPQQPLEPPGPISRFGSGVGRALMMPVDIAKSMWGDLEQSRIPGTTAVLSMAHEYLNRQRMAIENEASGDFAQETYNRLASIPIIGQGPAALIDRARSGDVAGAFGETAGIAAMGAATKLAGQSWTPKVRLNPTEAAASTWAQKAGIDVPAAVATGSPSLRGMESAVEVMPGAAGTIRQGKMTFEQQLRQTAGTLSKQAAPGAMTREPIFAGQNIVKQQAARVAKLNSVAKQNYDTVRQIAGNDVQQVQTGTRVSELGILGPDGKAMYRTEPIMETITAPVDYRPIKADMKALYDKLKEDLGSPTLDSFKKMNPGLGAIFDIANAPDVVPLSRAMADMQAAGNIAFERGSNAALRNRFEGLAVTLKQRLTPVVEQKIQELGPEATQAYQKGKQATRLKYDTADVLKSIAGKNWDKEPVKVYRALVQNDDAGVMALRAVAETSPHVIPDIAASVLEGILKPSLETGGFGQAKTAFNRWHRLGDETKQILFKDNPQAISDLDNFFQFSQQAQHSINPSGTGKVVGLLTTAGTFLVNPVRGAAYILSANQLAKMLYGPGGARLLTEGLKIPFASEAAPGVYTAILSGAGQRGIAPRKSWPAQ